MLDINYIKANPGILDRALENRNKTPIESELIHFDKLYRNALTSQQEIFEKRNSITKQFEKAKTNGLDTSSLFEEIGKIKEEMASIDEIIKEAEKRFFNLLSSIPNIPLDECPVGKDENDNVEIRRFEIAKNFDFVPKEHFEIGENLKMMDFKKAANIAGSRFVFLFGDLARLERAIAQFMLDTHTIEYGYKEVYVPLILNKDAMFGVGQLPKFEDDLYKTSEGGYLIPTAEASLTNIYSNFVLEEKELPLRFTSYTPCFRKESGAAGKDTKGMLRQHQFGKVELVSIVKPSQTKEEHERMTEAAENILKKLNIPFRTVVLCTGDMGFSSEKTYDIEVWLPGQNTYREISSCSRCGDFQARRMKTRFKNFETKKNEFVNTLNGSGLAVGRCLIAILENYQQKDGSVKIPDVLIPYFGKEFINCLQ